PSRRRHTSWPRDWSSDVCSSDLGRSMRKNVNIARNLDYMEVPEEVLIRPNELDDYRPEETLILCTGSQGEPLSALVRIAYGDHRSEERRVGKEWRCVVLVCR